MGMLGKVPDAQGEEYEGGGGSKPYSSGDKENQAEVEAARADFAFLAFGVVAVGALMMVWRRRRRALAGGDVEYEMVDLTEGGEGL